MIEQIFKKTGLKVILFCNVLMLILYEYDILSQMLRAQLLRRVMQLRQQ